MIHTAIILAGGFGTRLQAVVRDVPKPMAPVAGKPFLHYQLLYLKHHGIQHVIFSVGYLHEVIENYFGKKYQGLKISYALEEKPLGTGGGIRLAFEQCDDKEALVLNGDSFFDCDLQKLYATHVSKKANGTLALRQVENASRYGTINCNEQNRIIAFEEKKALAAPGTINAGVYILNKRDFFENSPTNSNFSIEKDFFEKQLQHLFFAGHQFDAYFIDIGLPEDYTQAQHDFERFTY